MSAVAGPSRGRVACLGVVVADIVGKPIDRLPARGTLELIDRLELHIGGNAANAAASLARLGEPVSLVGKVGDDTLGGVVAGALAQAGVDTTPLARDPVAPTSASLVTVHSDGERSFLHAAGANAAMRVEDILWDRLDGVGYLLIAGLQLMTGMEGAPMAEVAREARRRGMVTVLDTVMNPRSRGWDGLEPVLEHLDWCVPSIDEARQLTGESDPERQARRLLDAGAGAVAIKMGSRGCALYRRGEAPVTVPGFTVDVVDTLGAGDSWCAGFLTGLRHGHGALTAARIGNRVGADCVGALGATTGIRRFDDVLGRLGEAPA